MKYAEFLEKINKQAAVPHRTVSGGTYNLGIIEMVENVDVCACEAVVGGDWALLADAFTWDTTPQGYEYWRQVHMGCNPLTGDDRTFIDWLINRHYDGDGDDDDSIF